MYVGIGILDLVKSKLSHFSLWEHAKYVNTGHKYRE